MKRIPRDSEWGERMPGKPWTYRELAFLRDNYEDMTCEEIGRILGRSAAAVENQAERMGIYKKPRGRWSEEEIRFLTEHHADMTYRDIGIELGRSEESVHSMARYLGLRKRNRQQAPHRCQVPKRVADVADRAKVRELRKELLKRTYICAACVAEWDVPPGYDGFSYRHRLERQRCPRCVVSAETREIVEEMEAIQRAIRVERERERIKTRRLSGE